jgi:hypothetical protein
LIVRTPTAVTPAVAAIDGQLYHPWLRLRLSHGHLASPQSVGRQLALMPDRVTLKALHRLEMVAIQELDGCTLLLKDRLRPLLARWLEADGGGRLQWRLAARCRRWHLYGSAAAGQSGGDLAVRLFEVVEHELPSGVRVGPAWTTDGLALPARTRPGRGCVDGAAHPG